MIELSVIIISFNTKDVTLACLVSLYQSTKGLDFEVIVVDNASTDGSPQALEAFGDKHHNFTILKSDINLGFGRANNLGAKSARGRYLLFLNSDTLITSNLLPTCLSAVKKDPSLGAYSCNLFNLDQTQQILGGSFPTLLRLITWQFFFDDLPLIGPLLPSIHPHPPGFSFLHRLGLKSHRNTTYSKISYPDWITGAFMIIPADTFSEVNGFDEKIFMYTEEMELCYRLRQLGKKIVFDPQTSIVHLGAASGGSYLAITSEVQNLLYFWQKHQPSWQQPLAKIIFAIGSLLRYVIFGIIKDDKVARQSYAKTLRLSL